MPSIGMSVVLTKRVISCMSTGYEWTEMQIPVVCLCEYVSKSSTIKYYLNSHYTERGPDSLIQTFCGSRGNTLKEENQSLTDLI